MTTGGFTGVTGSDWTTAGGVRGEVKVVPTVCEKRMDEAGRLGSAGVERAVAGGSMSNGLKADGDC